METMNQIIKSILWPYLQHEDIYPSLRV